MKRTVWLWELFGFALTSLLGTLLHFLYEWMGGAVWVAPFSGVNESTWEHMKLIFWPMLLYAVLRSPFFKDYPDLWSVSLRGILIALGLIPALFYAYNGIIGHSPDWVNIAIFFISAAVAYFYQWRALGRSEGGSPTQAKLCLLTVALLFVLFTFLPPRIALFKDPITGGYGVGLSHLGITE